MKQKPILFNNTMVRRILSGDKTETRRVMKPGTLNVLNSSYHREHPEVPEKQLIEKLRAPPCDPGDVLWVRETWSMTPDGLEYLFLADADGNAVKDRRGNWHVPKWRPSIHMPYEAARIFLRVEAVRAERLQEIDAEGIRREGLTTGAAFAGDLEIGRQEFALIWNGTVKRPELTAKGWDADPWVWVIRFERCERPEGA